jgi:four helix bundle protein
VKDFTDLNAWQLARQLRQQIYLVARKLPAEEKHVLFAQIRRAALSVTANIAEGFGRFSFQENIQSCRLARGSAFEVRDHPIAALDGGSVTRKDWEELDSLAQRAIQVLNGYIRSTREMQKREKP